MEAAERTTERRELNPMFCTHCGSKLPEGARFCTNCGTPVEDAPAEAAPVAEPAPVKAVEASADEVEDNAEDIVAESAQAEDSVETATAEDVAEPVADTPAAEVSESADTAPATQDEPDAAEALDPAEAEAIFEDADNAAVAVDFPDDDPTSLAEPVSNDDATSLFNAADDATTVVATDEDAEATAAAMESLGVAAPTAGDTVVENPIDMNAYAAPSQQTPADMTMQQPLPQQAPVAQDAAQPQTAAPHKKKRWPIVAGLGLVAAGAAVAAIMFLAPNANAVEVTSGSQDAVVCTVDTKVLPKKKDRVIHKYTATLTPTGGGKSYKIKVNGDGGFTIGDFGKVKPGSYRCVIETPKGETVQRFNTTVVKDGATDKDGNKPAENVTVKTSGNESKEDTTGNTDPGSSQDTSTSGSSSSSKDDATDDTGSDDATDDSSSSSDSSASSSSSSSKKDSKNQKNKKSENSGSNSTAQKDPIAPATIDDQTKSDAYTAYVEKVQDLLDTYGKPAIASLKNNVYQLGGLQVAKLVDFNGDGLDELVTVHSKTNVDEFNKKTHLTTGDYVLDVWAFDGSKVVNIYTGSPQATNGGYIYVSFEKEIGDDSGKVYLSQFISKDKAYLLTGKRGTKTEEKFLSFDGTEFAAPDRKLARSDFNDDSAFLIAGYKENLEEHDENYQEGKITIRDLNLNDSVDAVNNIIAEMQTKASGLHSGAEAEAQGAKGTTKSSKSSKSRRSSSSSSSSSSDDSYDDDDDYSYDDDSDYDDDDYDSDDDNSDYDDDYDNDDDTDSYASQSSQPVEFTDWDY